MDYAKVLLAVCPHGKAAIRQGFANSMQACIDTAELTNLHRLGLFIGQCAHESAGFQTTQEYASGAAYNGRKDLGNTQKGDGPRFKGRGLIQLTGRANYYIAGTALGVDLEADPLKAGQFPYAATIAAWYWKSRDVNAAADLSPDSVAINRTTRKINGGLNGLQSRTDMIERAWSALTNLKGTLIAQAAVETKKVQSKTKTASAIATSGVATASAAAHPAVQAAPGHVSAMLIFCGVVIVGVAAAIVYEITQHQTAATALTEAAKGA